jgi:hypothetical protein
MSRSNLEEGQALGVERADGLAQVAEGGGVCKVQRLALVVRDHPAHGSSSALFPLPELDIGIWRYTMSLGSLVPARLATVFGWLLHPTSVGHRH